MAAERASAGRTRGGGAGKGRAQPRRRGRRTVPARWTFPAWRGLGGGRWVFIGGFSLALLIGLPLAHALIGEVGAILLGTFAFGFVVGRMTQRR